MTETNSEIKLKPVKINYFLRNLFFSLVVKPLMFIVIGLNVRNYEKLITNGPCIIVANHNSHLDTLALMSIFSLDAIKIIRPVAAADYFLTNKALAWFSQVIIGIIPLDRNLSYNHDPFVDVIEAIDQNQIIIIYPEGSRGIPEKIDKFKSGIAHLAKRRPQTPILPIFLHGFGKTLPKGEALLVPFFCDIFIGDKILWTGNKNSFMELLEQKMSDLSNSANFLPWD